MSSRKWKNPNAGLFYGFWFDLNGRKIRQLRRNEYPEAYRLHRIGVELGLQRPLTLAEKTGIHTIGRRGPWHPRPAS
jgi:hypothetical protein